ncbi:hypothetical protein CS542_09115 [Pedobacter sp. IW39]|nr:hypothetical protein CS542_09115 [Pedobacter sp. IW39]
MIPDGFENYPVRKHLTRSPEIKGRKCILRRTYQLSVSVIIGWKTNRHPFSHNLIGHTYVKAIHII